MSRINALDKVKRLSRLKPDERDARGKHECIMPFILPHELSHRGQMACCSEGGVKQNLVVSRISYMSVPLCLKKRAVTGRLTRQRLKAKRQRESTSAQVSSAEKSVPKLGMPVPMPPRRILA